MCEVDHGLHVRPHSGFALSKASRVCGTFVLAMMMAPALRSVTTSYCEGADGEYRMGDMGDEDGKGWRRKRKTYGSVALGWFLRPLRVSDRTVESLHVD